MKRTLVCKVILVESLEGRRAVAYVAAAAHKRGCPAESHERVLLDVVGALVGAKVVDWEASVEAGPRTAAYSHVSMSGRH